eukprot:527791-Pelagomonas_calceolata.AAC.1
MSPPSLDQRGADKGRSSICTDPRPNLQRSWVPAHCNGLYTACCNVPHGITADKHTWMHAACKA